MKGHLSCCQSAPEAMTAVAGSESQDRKYRIEPVVIELSGTHASQISGCAHCLRLHTADALRQGRERGNSTSEFGRLVAQEMPRLRRYARSLTRDRERADDLVQPNQPSSSALRL